MTTPNDSKKAELRRAALEYHEFPTPGKIAVEPTKQLVNSAIWRSPTLPASLPRARRSSPTRPTPSSTPRAAI